METYQHPTPVRVPCLEAYRSRPVVWGSPARTPRQDGPVRDLEHIQATLTCYPVLTRERERERESHDPPEGRDHVFPLLIG